MKEKLQEHFGEKIVIITVNERNVTFRSTVGTTISELYEQPKEDDYEVEQIMIAVGLKKVWIRYDIQDSARRSQQGLQPKCLPPTSAAAVYHSLRFYHQVQQWKGVALPPRDWSWKLADGRLYL